MLHPKRVLLMLYYAMRRRIRRALHIPQRPKPPPVLGYPIEHVVERHSWIARSFLKHGPPDLDLRGKAVCEVGAGDCLAASSLFLAKGAARVDIIEVEPPVVTEKQLQVLETLQAQGFPVDLSIIRKNGGLHLDPERVTYHRCYMEQFHSENSHELIFSFSVLEHVEDLPGFYASCWRTLRPGGWMLHMIDLGGHELFEDPLPPLDFQTYSNLLYGAMFPKYGRATRRFFSEHVDAVKSAGFEVVKVTPTRLADDAYLEQLWPKLRAEARARGREEIRVVEFALLARKPLSR
jgi:2-polyprenyl-3-methyl-5-hydroxy-6-metoxy-1,4-benzoquinol methylase